MDVEWIGISLLLQGDLIEGMTVGTNIRMGRMLNLYGRVKDDVEECKKEKRRVSYPLSVFSRDSSIPECRA